MKSRPDWQEVRRSLTVHAVKRTARQRPSSTTRVSNATTLIYAIGVGITAAAGTKLALQLFLVKGFRLYSFQLQDHEGPVSLCIVTTSPSRHWVICAPAAFLGCRSRFSGSFSGIEPLFPVTRYNHCSPINYNQVDRAEIWMIHRRRKDMRFESYYESPSEVLPPLVLI